MLPRHVECCTEKIFEWIREELDPNVRVNILGQYRPAGKARDYPELSRRVSGEEMKQAYKIADEIGLQNTIK